MLLPLWLMLGSSPHTRGAQGWPCSRPPIVGIIPAYAGSTSPARDPGLGRGDHPRIRGEHKDDNNFYSTLAGSSPHTRGALS